MHKVVHQVVVIHLVVLVALVVVVVVVFNNFILVVVVLVVVQKISFHNFFGGGHRQQQQQRPRYPQGPIYDKDPNVFELTQQNWPFAKTETEDDKDQIWLINFYSHDCGTCHEFSASYKQIAKELKGSVKVAAINCAQQDHICKRQGIESYPTIKVYPFHQHAHPVAYTGRVEKQAVLDFANEHVPNFIVTLTGDKIESTIQRLPTYLPQVFIIVNPNKKPLLSPTLITLARTMRTKFKFFAILNEPQKSEFQYFVQHFGEKAPNKKLIINQHTDKPQLFVHTPYQILPYVGQLTAKAVSDHLNELSTTFKQKGYYSSEFATFIRTTRLAVRLTNTLYNSMIKTPTAQYQNVFITCPNIIQDLVTLPQFNNDNKSNNNNLIELQENNYTMNNIIQYIRSLLYKSNNLFVLDVNDNEMVTILSKRTNGEIDNEIQNIKQQCEIITKPEQILNTKQNVLLGLGLNLKRSKYTLAAISKTDDISNAIEFTNRLSMFVEGNDNGPTGAKNFKKITRDEL
eukprot:UN00498